MNGDVTVNVNGEINANVTISDSQIASATVVTQEDTTANGSAVIIDEIYADAQLELEDEIVADGSVSTEEETVASGRLVLPTVGAGENNVIEVIKVNGTELPVEDKTVDITVPTSVGQLANDENYVSESQLARVAFTGEYRDIYGTPTIPTVPTDVSAFNNDAGYITKDVNNLANYTRSNQLAPVALSNDYNDLTNKPEIPNIPSKTSELINDSGFITKSVDNLENYSKTSEFSPIAFSGDYYDLANAPRMTQVSVSQVFTAGTKIASINVNGVNTNLFAPSKVTHTSQIINDGEGNSYFLQASDVARVAMTGSYNDLTDKPTTTAVQVTQVLHSGTKIATIKVDNVNTDLYAPEPGHVDQVQSNWTQTNSSKVDYIKNKPNLATVATSGSYNDLSNKPIIPVVPTNVSDFTNDAGYITNDVNNLANYTLSSNLSVVATSGSYNDLSNKPAIPAAQIQSDWNQSDSTQLDYIKNKPTIPSLTGYATETFVTNSISTHNSSNLSHSDIRSYISDINAVIPSAATSSNQLADKAFVNSSINTSAAFFRGTFATKAALDAVQWQTSDPTAPNYVTNNDYAYVEADETHNDEAWRYLYVLGTGWQPQFKVNDTPFTQSQLDSINSGATSILIGKITANETAISNLAAVASSGSYTDLINTPSMPTATSDLNNDSGFITNSVNDLTNYTLTSALATVATSGSYNDLSNKPTIPVVPTNVSDFTNDAGYITNSVNNLTNYTLSSNLSAVATSGSYNDLSNKPTIPTKTSDLTNDGSDNTSTYVEADELATVATSGSYADLSNTPTIQTVSATQIQSTGTKIATITIDNVDTDIYAPAGGGGSSVQSDWNQTDPTADDYIKNKPLIPPAIATYTESLDTDTIAPDTMKSYSNGLTSATLTVSTDVTMLHEWAGTFTTGASQTSVSIAMSDNATIFWTSNTAGLITSTLYAFSVAGNSTVGYTGSIVPLIYT